MVTFETLLKQAASDHVLVVHLHRPDALNALSTRMAQELLLLFRDFRSNHLKVRAVVLTGTGDRAFCAGADLKERREMSDDAWFGQHRIFEQAAAAMGDCPVPMIAAVNGVAFGGGCELALTCDLILASSGARFAQPESKLGIMPGLGGTQRLPRRIGLARASEMLLTGDAIDAGCALSWGLVNRVCAPEKLLLEALALAERIASNGPRAVQQIKQVIGSGWGLPIHQALELEIDAYNTVVGTQDRREGIRAFHEKRKPVFDGT